MTAPGHAAPQTLLAAVLPDGREQRWLTYALIAVVGSLLLTASAKVSVPFWPVPMTMQTTALLLIGATCGLRLAVATVGLYIAQGAAGLPVFASGGGLAYMAGPTGGYIIGFLVCVALIGALADRGWTRRIGPCLIALILGQAAIYAFGIPWMTVVTGLGATDALWNGMVVFLPATVLDLALVTALVWGGWYGLGQR